MKISLVILFVAISAPFAFAGEPNAEVPERKLISDAALTGTFSAEGGNGVRGGGTAFRCDGGPLEIVDLSVANRDGLKLRALSRRGIENAIAERLAADPVLLGLVLGRYFAHGPAIADGTRPGWTLLRAGEQSYAGTFDALPLENIPPSCQLLELAEFIPAGADFSPKLLWKNARLLPPAQISILELHEAVFSVAKEFYGHQNAVLTQKLVGLVLADSIDPAEAKARMENFVGFARGPGNGETSRTFLATSASPRDCPRVVNFQRTGGYGTQFTTAVGGALFSLRLAEIVTPEKTLNSYWLYMNTPLKSVPVGCEYDPAMNSDSPAADWFAHRLEVDIGSGLYKRDPRFRN